MLITIDFRARSGYEHPVYQNRLAGYRRLLGKLGHSEPEIERIVANLHEEASRSTPAGN